MRKGGFYPSSLGNLCDRFLYNSYNGLIVEQVIDPITRRIFDCGDYLGYRYEKYFEKMGILLGTETPVRCDLPPISGRLDFLIKHEKTGTALIELKSINQRGFLALKGPKDDHYIQIQIYLNLTNNLNGIVLYENKNDQSIKAFAVEKNEATWEMIRDRCLNIMALTDSEKTGLLFKKVFNSAI